MERKKQIYILTGLILAIVSLSLVIGNREAKTIYSVERVESPQSGVNPDQSIEDVRLKLIEGKYIRVVGDAIEDGIVQARIIVLGDSLDSVESIDNFTDRQNDIVAQDVENTQKPTNEIDFETVRAEMANLPQAERQAKMAELGFAPGSKTNARTGTGALSTTAITYVGSIISFDNAGITITVEGTGSVIALYSADTHITSK